MEITEHIALFLRANGFDATNGQMPSAPDRVATVYATGIKPRRDDEGSRFQVIVRSAPNADTAVADIMRIIDLLDDFSGITSIESPYFSRIVVEGGASNLGPDSNNRLLYSANFRAWYC